MRLKWLLGLLVLLTTPSVANPADEERHSIGGYKGLLGECIDPVSGVFYDFEDDMKVPGSTFHVKRMHSSNEPGWPSTRFEGWGYRNQPSINFFARWGSNISTLLYHLPYEKNVFVQDLSGYHLNFKYDLSCSKGLNEELFKGWSNLTQVHEGAQNDAHNHKIYHDNQISKWVVTNPQGVKRLFGSSIFTDGKHYKQVWMCAESQRQLPSGITWNFDYIDASVDRLACMKLGWIEERNRRGEKIQQIEVTHRGTRIASPTGQWVEYKTKNVEGYPLLLTEVTRSDGPSIKYEYIYPQMTFEMTPVGFSDAPNRYIWHAVPPRITKKIYEEGKYRRMEYKPFRDVCRPACHPLSYNPMDGNITAYYGPVGKNGKEEAIYRLDYKPLKTFVTHGDGKFEIYEYDNLFMLKDFKEHDANKICQRSRKFIYYSEGAHKGRVRSEALFEASQTPSVFNSFEYDATGNVIKKTTKGRLCSLNSSLIVKDSGELDPRSQADTYIVEFKYGPAPFHLKEEEKYPDGRRFVYQYEDGTNNLSAKIVYQNDNIVERYFYNYDKYAQIELEIHDDGSSLESSNLEGVYHRKWMVRESFDEDPFKGLLKREQLYVYDAETGSNIRLQEFEYTYNSSRRLSSKKCTECVLGTSYTLQYEYDSRGNIIREVDNRGGVISRTFAKDGLVTWEQGPIPGTQKFYTYDSDRRLNKLIEVVDNSKNQRVTSYEYDFMGRLIRIEGPTGAVIENVYDWDGRIVSQIKRHVLDETSQGYRDYATTYRYDIANHRIYEKDDDGFETEAAYNILDQPHYTKNQLGLIEHYTYDPEGRLIAKTQYEGAQEKQKELYSYNNKGQLASVELEAGGRRYTLLSTEYEGLYKCLEIDALGHQDSWKYDGVGNVIEHKRLDIESGKESREQFVYDGLSRVIIKRTWQDAECYLEHHTRYSPAGDIVEKWTQTSTGEKYSYVHHEYDVGGRCTQISEETDETVAITLVEYDGLGNKTSLTDSEGYKTDFSYEYFLGKDREGVAVISTEKRPDGATIETHLDYLGKVLCYKLFDASHVLKKHQKFGYNASGKLVYREEQTIFQQLPEGELEGELTDEEWVVTRVAYGPMGNVVKRWENYGGPLERLRTWEYNVLGFCTKKVEPSGLIHQYSYDPRGFMTTCTSSDGTINYTYEHDDLGRLLKVTNQLTQKFTSRNYDAWGRIVEDIQEEGYVFRREWNLMGQPVKDIYPDGKEVVREYRDGFLRSTEIDNQVHRIQAYNKQGLASLEAQPNDLGFLRSSYDVKQRLTSFSMPGYEAKEIVYDARGDLTSRRLIDGTVQTYEYDVLSQLQKESGLCERSYNHDSRQRRRAQNSETVSLDDLDQLISIGKENQVQESFDYDLDGHLTIRYKAQGDWKYTYDAWSRLINIEADDLNIRYDYDAFNRRTVATYNKAGVIEEKKMGYLGQMLACLYSEAKTEQRYFVRAIASERGDTLLWKSNETLYFPITDMSGSSIGWRDLSGNIIASWQFDCFGITLGTRMGPWSCWSKYQDEFTGMVYFGSRDYIPEQGRWLTRDLKGEIDGSNLYAFVGNNPVTRYDEWGNTWRSDSRSSGNSFINTILTWFCNWIQSFYAKYDTHVHDAYADLENKVNIKGKSALVLARYNGPDKNKDAVVIQPNGIMNTYKDVLRSSIQTAKDSKCDVYAVYSHSVFWADIPKALLQRNGFYMITGAEHVMQIAFEIIRVERPSVEIFMNPHSHGNQIVANFVKMNESNEAMKPVLKSCQVRAMAGSGLVPHKPLGSYKNTVCTNDFIIRFLDGGAIEKQREAGVLEEPKPKGNFFQNLIPDHARTGPTCTTAYNNAISEWEQKND